MKHFKSRRRKLFKFDGDYRIAGPDSIIHVLKVGYEQKTVGTEHFFKYRTYISRYRYAVTIDLWFFLFRFEWIGRERNA